MRKSDRELGMHQTISRRDFIHDSAFAALGLGALGPGVASTGPPPGSVYYPPTRTGIRGSHPGSFEVAHGLALEGRKWGSAEATGESYDLVVVGGGISGLASAYYYRQRHPGARILILENHDDFGGHAKRNEFHQGGVMRLAWGGVFNLEYPKFSATVHQLLDELGVDIERLRANDSFRYGNSGRNDPAIWFDADTYGEDRLVDRCTLRNFALKSLAARVDAFPISAESRRSLKRFALARRDITAGMSDPEVEKLMTGTSYIDFLIRHGGLTAEAAELYVKTTDGYWGVSAHSLSVVECLEAGLPIRHLLGGQHEQSLAGEAAMFPDGNASVARLLVRNLVPGVTPGDEADDIVTARFSYSRLDEPSSPVRLRLNSTVVHVANDDDTVTTTYVHDGRAFEVASRHCVLACYHSIIPYLCPQLPAAQKEAQRYQVKRPLLLTNVLLKSSRAADKLGITGAYCPGRMHAATWLVKGIQTEGYRHEWSDDGPVVMMFWGTLAPSSRELDIKAQHRDSRRQLLGLGFEDYEREVRTVLDGMLGPGGFDVRGDVLAITVNRWPHGYAYDYLDLWDPQWPEGEAPHEIARRPFGNIAIANADAGADAYTHVAIDQAWRAVGDLVG